MSPVSIHIALFLSAYKDVELEVSSIRRDAERLITEQQETLKQENSSFKGKSWLRRSVAAISHHSRKSDLMAEMRVQKRRLSNSDNKREHAKLLMVRSIVESYIKKTPRLHTKQMKIELNVSEAIHTYSPIKDLNSTCNEVIANLKQALSDINAAADQEVMDIVTKNAPRSRPRYIGNIDTCKGIKMTQESLEKLMVQLVSFKAKRQACYAKRGRADDVSGVITDSAILDVKDGIIALSALANSKRELGKTLKAINTMSTEIQVEVEQARINTKRQIAMLRVFMMENYNNVVPEIQKYEPHITTENIDAIVTKYIELIVHSNHYHKDLKRIIHDGSDNAE